MIRRETSVTMKMKTSSELNYGRNLVRPHSFIYDISNAILDVIVTSDVSTRPQSPGPASTTPSHLTPPEDPVEQPETPPSPGSTSEAAPPTKKTRSKGGNAGKATADTAGGDTAKAVKTRGRGRKNRA